MQSWRDYSEKYLLLSMREQVLVLLTGLAVVGFGLFNIVIDPQLIKIEQAKKNITKIQQSQRTTNNTMNDLVSLISGNPRAALEQKITDYENSILVIDEQLLTLTSELISPVKMRRALIDLLDVQKGVSLLSFELLGSEPVVSPASDLKSMNTSAASHDETITGNTALTLYKHGIKIKLKGSYFQLRDYLMQLEKLDWKFYWQGFDYQVQEYPSSVLEINIYSLSTTKEFVGV